MPGSVSPYDALKRCVTYLILLGLFFTFRGYRSREVDQAYRLPILLHAQDHNRFATDPFVRSFDRFNPHRGYLALLDGTSRPIGLSLALAALFGLTFLVTVSGVDRLGSLVWSDLGAHTGLVAASLVLIALAGNIGTNHLFEPMLLDRLIAFGFGWQALAFAMGRSRWGSELSATAVGLAALIHPSVGLQLTMLLAVSWMAWLVLGVNPEISAVRVARAIAWLGLALVPGLSLNMQESRLLLEGLSPSEIRLLSAQLQSPQHMLPHLWRLPQWLAWGCYPILALCALRPLRSNDSSSIPVARKQLLVVLGTVLIGLAAACIGIEGFQNLRLTLFQPFRMATIARGLCLVLVAGRLRDLWLSGETMGRIRATLIAVGLLGDWMLVVATAFEVVMSVRDVLADRWHVLGTTAGLLVLGTGLAFLSRHDTESGHWPLLAAIVLGLGLGLGRIRASFYRPWSARRATFRMAAAWAVPIAALVANLIPDHPGARAHSFTQMLVRRCRFAEVPVDDLERIAIWCREHTPGEARFIGPPGPKTFRLWSRRALAFNRAGSPYHARGLADWSRRFRDHVGFNGSNEDFVAAYLRDRHALERSYDRLSNVAKAELAIRQGARYVLATAPNEKTLYDGPLRLLHVEGRYAIYRVERPAVQVADRTFSESPQRHRQEPDNPVRTR